MELPDCLVPGDGPAESMVDRAESLASRETTS
jgi:hypothetical protein